MISLDFQGFWCILLEQLINALENVFMSCPLRCGIPTCNVAYPLAMWHTHLQCGIPTCNVAYSLAMWHTHLQCGMQCIGNMYDGGTYWHNITSMAFESLHNEIGIMPLWWHIGMMAHWHDGTLAWWHIGITSWVCWQTWGHGGLAWRGNGFRSCGSEGHTPSTLPLS